jgi:hypothetical protein
VNIWRGPWLPRGISRRPITPRGGCLLSQVAELIDPVTGEWDEQLMKEVFWEEDSAVILALPVHEGRQNSIAWHSDSHGRFSVRSAYRCAVMIYCEKGVGRAPKRPAGQRPTQSGRGFGSS